jgi:ribosome-associated protein
MASKKKTGKAGTPRKSSPAKKKATAARKPAGKKASSKKAASKPAARKKAAKPAKASKPAGKKAGAARSKAAAPARKPSAPLQKKVLQKPVKPQAPREPQDPTVELARRIAVALVERGAENVIIRNVTDVTSFADCFVICEAKAERQVNALARGLTEAMKKENQAPHSVEGLEQSHWVLMDFSGVVAHIFYEPARQYYDLDGLWGDTPRIEFDAAGAQKKAAAARRLAQDTADDGSDASHDADLDA